jgi:hypothetical protein
MRDENLTTDNVDTPFFLSPDIPFRVTEMHLRDRGRP